MDRELVLAVLAILLGGGALTAAGWWPRAATGAARDISCERRAWRRIWLPLTPALVTLGALAGWALREPQDAERVPNPLLLLALPFVAILLRAVWRAGQSLAAANDDYAAAAAGLLRPRVIVSPRIVAVLDDAALAAALAHEQAHVRHRDPLRLWLAQIATDLLWPWPAAAHRLLGWKCALEFARDDEARRAGVAGPDLAAAIVAALRLTRVAAPTGVATLGADETFVKRRIERLLRPLELKSAPPRWSAFWMLLPIGLGIGLAVIAGTTFGEQAVRSLFAALG
jgi:BlaR1 peptidase M56